MLLAAAVAATSAACHGSTDPRALRCGGELWRLKTLSDQDRESVNLTAKSTTIAAIQARPYPQPLPTRRRTPFQRQTWEVVSQITSFRLEGGEVRLILYDNRAYMNAVLPTPSCLTSSTRAGKDMVSTWEQFASNCARPTRAWQSLGAIVYVRGAGFWGQRGTRRGAAPNGAELHPVTGIRIVS